MDNCGISSSQSADLVHGVLRACAGVRVLATSREVLGVPGEVVWRLRRCGIIGGGTWLALQLIGVPYAALLGLVWALGEFVPGIGPFLSAIPTIVLGFTVSPEIGIAAAVFSLVWSHVENNVITPKVMGNAVELHPLVILVALLVGSELLGAPGALLAIPVAATLAVVVDEIRLERMRTQLEPTENGTVPSESLVQAPDPFIHPS